MKKVLAILAATAAAVGSTIFAAPADAVQQNVGVTVKVEPAIYLRTFQKVDLVVTQGDLGGVTGDQTQVSTNGSTPISRTRPVLTGGTLKTVIDKEVKELYAVWGTSDTNVKVTVTASTPTLTEPTTTRTAKMSVKNAAEAGYEGKVDPVDPVVKGVMLTFDFGRAPSAGTYVDGVLTIDATSP